jgi:hypothetical protein
MEDQQSSRRQRAQAARRALSDAWLDAASPIC